MEGVEGDLFYNMLQIDDTIISFDLFDECFACDLSSCKGICCIEGDAGAPLEEEEIETLGTILPVIWEDLSEVSKELINTQGFFILMKTLNPLPLL